MPHLKVRFADGSSNEVPLVAGKELLVGRQPDCDLVLAEASISRKHARIYAEQGRWMVADLKSSLGTLVNGERIAATRALAAGDSVKIGENLLVFDAANLGTGTAREAPRTGEISADPWLAEQTGDSVPPPQVLESRKVDEGDLLRKARTIQAVDLRQLMADPRATDDDARQLAASGDARSATLAQTDAQLLALVRIGTEIHSCTDVESVCSVAVEMGMRATGADRGLLALRGSGDRWRVKASRITQKGELVPSTVRVSRTFVQRVLEKREGMIARDVGQDIDLSGAKSIVAMDIRSMVCVPLLNDDELVGWLYLDKIGLASSFASRDLDVLSLIAFQTGAEIGRMEEQERRMVLSRCFSPDVRKHLEQSGKNAFVPESKTVTVLFSDVQGFTRMSEGLEPVKLKEMLDVYFERMTEILVDRFGATLDKYIGDAIMALFGAPFPKDERSDARNAVSSALEMLRVCEELRREDPIYADLHIRIGINTGRVVAGMIGSSRKTDYSVLGDTVNVASRLESTGEPDRIQIGESTWKVVKDLFDCAPAGERKLKNRGAPVKCWWVEGPRRETGITERGKLPARAR